MIEFYGKVSPTCNGKANRERMRDHGKGAFILSPICAALGAFFLFFFYRFTPLLSVSFCLFFFSLNLLIVGILSNRSAKKPPIPRPSQDTTNIVFDDSWVTYEEIELNRTATFHVNDIRRAVDLGDCYLLFVANKYAQHIVCQKSLLVEGEIDEFEALIADKLK